VRRIALGVARGSRFRAWRASSTPSRLSTTVVGEQPPHIDRLPEMAGRHRVLIAVDAQRDSRGFTPPRV